MAECLGDRLSKISTSAIKGACAGAGQVDVEVLQTGNNMRWHEISEMTRSLFVLQLKYMITDSSNDDSL